MPTLPWERVKVHSRYDTKGMMTLGAVASQPTDATDFVKAAQQANATDKVRLVVVASKTIKATTRRRHPSQNGDEQTPGKSYAVLS